MTKNIRVVDEYVMVVGEMREVNVLFFILQKFIEKFN